MRIEYKPNALQTIFHLGAFVESNNTEGSGSRFIDKFFNHIEKYALPNVQYGLCVHLPFRSRGYSCVFYNDWVIAFKIEQQVFVVYEIALGSLFA